MEILTIENLNFTYPEAEEKALDSVSLSVKEGEFVVLCGESGCGKTTLLKIIKRELAPHGELTGNVFFYGADIHSLDDRRAASEIGYVLQSPEAQIVTDKVWHELAFGLESLGHSTDEIRLRVGEMANYFGITGWFRSNTAELSGGQKQLLNLASVMAMSPKLLLLDEPTSQLDPIAAANFITTLHKLNRDLGITVILVEHRLEEVFPIADRVAVMEKGRLIAFDAPKAVCAVTKKHPISAGFPASVRIWQALGRGGMCPLTVKEGRQFLSENYQKKTAPIKEYTSDKSAALTLSGVWFRYERELPDILRGTDLEVETGEIFCLLGGNGSGKTTTLKVISGSRKAYRGKVCLFGKNINDYKPDELHRHLVALLPQNVQTCFLKKTVREDLSDICRVMTYGKTETEEMIRNMAERFGLTPFLDRHPYDLSGGEMQKCALAKILLTKPKLLLLDEPTKGIDAYSKLGLAQLLTQLRKSGMTLLIVTHDVEFAATVADRCALFFDGEILSPSVPQKIFGINHFYTTAASRIARDTFENAVTADEIIALGEQDHAKE